MGNDFNDWLNNPVTQSLMTKLTMVRLNAMEDWAQERFVGVDANDTERKTAKALGAIAIIDQILSLESLEDLA